MAALVTHSRPITTSRFKPLFSLLKSFRTSTATDTKQTGLYGFDHLKNPKGFQRFVDDAIDRSGELISYISSKPSSAEIIKAMDEISDTVCSVVDSAELCRHTHPDREFVEQANVASMRMDEYLHVRFNENIVDDPGFVDIYPATLVPKQLHHLARPIFRSARASKGRSDVKGKGYRIATDQVALSSILQWVPDAEVRKLAYIKGNSVPHANLDVLDKLIAARHEFAQIMGCRSYAEFAAHPNMASSPDVVISFLNEMSDIVRPKADEEFRRLRDYKRAKTGQIFEDLDPWDETYFSAMMKSSNYTLNSSVISSYFPLAQCIEGLKLLVESLFGATFHNIPLAPGESWHRDVLKMSLHHPEEGDLGYLYLDLYSRRDKYPGCAHFAIKGGRRVSESECQLPV